jgi:23S rRNA pseudouridine955/2504/2580 synthase
VRAREHDAVEVVIDAASAGMRLDRYLRKLLPDVPLSGIHRMLRKGGALLKGARAAGADRLVVGDVLRLVLASADADTLRRRLAAPGVAPVAGTGNIPIIYRDEHVLAFDKPSGIAAHPGTRHPIDQTVLGELLAVAGTSSAVFTPGLVGRLDRDTSGVQLAGVSAQGLREMQRMLRSGEISKTYVALVRSRGVSGRGRIDLPLEDLGEGARRMRVVEPGTQSAGSEVLSAVTNYCLTARGEGVALAEVVLETGRQHQIRAHLAHIGAPLAGDVRYGDKRWNIVLSRRHGLKRLFLHCARATFVHPLTGKTIDLVSELPDELISVSDALINDR